LRGGFSKTLAPKIGEDLGGGEGPKEIQRAIRRKARKNSILGGEKIMRSLDHKGFVKGQEILVDALARA